MTTDRKFKEGDRVRTRIHIPSADWALHTRADLPIGSQGLVAGVHRVGCSVLMDDDVDQLPIYVHPDEIEHAGG